METMNLKCRLYPSTFSGEAVVEVIDSQGGRFKGTCPLHYLKHKEPLPGKGIGGIEGTIQVFVLSIVDKVARVSVPTQQDRENLDVPVNALQELSVSPFQKLTQSVMRQSAALDRSLTNLAEKMQELRVVMKYQRFDLEATRRENEALRKQLEELKREQED